MTFEEWCELPAEEREYKLGGLHLCTGARCQCVQAALGLDGFDWGNTDPQNDEGPAE